MKVKTVFVALMFVGTGLSVAQADSKCGMDMKHMSHSAHPPIYHHKKGSPR